MNSSRVYLLRTFAEPIDIEQPLRMAEEGRECMTMYRVNWIDSLLSTDGHHLFCRFDSPDTDSTRRALLDAGADTSRMWPGTEHEANPRVQPNVLVERSFPEAAVLEEVQAREDAVSWCLDLHDVIFVRTFFSLDRRNMVCLYQAPDAEAVRAVQRQSGLPFDRAWAFTRIQPPGI